MLLAQKLALVALRTTSGHPRNSSGNLSDALVGLLVADLSLQGRVSFASDALTVADSSPTGDALLDTVLDVIAGHPDADTKGQFQHVGRALSGQAGGAIAAVCDSLVVAGLATKRDRHLLGATDQEWHPDAAARDGVLAGIRASARDGAEPDTGAAVLLASLGPTDLVRLVFPDKADRKSAKARIKTVLAEVPLAADVVDAVKQQQAARHLRMAGSLGGAV